MRYGEAAPDPHNANFSWKYDTNLAVVTGVSIIEIIIQNEFALSQEVASQ